jgi:catechol 2,3-dioxygenase-like lactoylglutathione lyase family enzyme
MSETASATNATARLECVIPILRVTDLKASLRWYQAVLGFTKDWEAGDDPAKPTIASVSRDGLAVMLTEYDQGVVGGWVWVGVSDIEPLVEELTAKGVELVLPPTNFSWAYEMRVEDPDGNVLRFGSDTRKDLPVKA